MYKITNSISPPSLCNNRKNACKSGCNQPYNYWESFTGKKFMDFTILDAFTNILFLTLFYAPEPSCSGLYLHRISCGFIVECNTM